MLTLAQFKERVDATLLTQLTTSDPEAVGPDDKKLGHALTDAWGVIDGYIARLPPEAQPGIATLEAYQAKLALGVIAGNRAGKEFDSIRSAANRAVTFLASLGMTDTKAGVVEEMAGEAPGALFDDPSLGEFGALAGGTE